MNFIYFYGPPRPPTPEPSGSWPGTVSPGIIPEHTIQIFMYFRQIFEKKLAQYAYLIGCQQTGEAIVIDPMRDIDRYREAAAGEELSIVAAADTHIHADYLSGLREFAELGVTVYASDEGGEDWKYEWLKDSRYEARLVKGGDEFSIGNIRFRVYHTPGHTPEHVSYTVTDGASAEEPMGILTGDFVFVGDLGRPDLLETAAGQKGVMRDSARQLYRSVREFRNMPDYLQVWPGHGAGSACGKSLGSVPESTVGYELRFNPSILAAESEEQFVENILEGQPEPPLYFARMKRDNRVGPSLLDRLPVPARISVHELIDAASGKKTVILDCRERMEFMSGHLPGSLLSPFNRKFNTVAGCYIEEESEIYLVIEKEHLEEAVRDLVRIGLDRIAGYITPEQLLEYFRKGGKLDSIHTLDFGEAAGLTDDSSSRMLDVRRASEFNEGHIEGAVNISHTRLRDRMGELSKEIDWLVHCKTGARASVASALLKREGFRVRYINDLFSRWEGTTSGS